MTPHTFEFLNVVFRLIPIFAIISLLKNYHTNRGMAYFIVGLVTVIIYEKGGGLFAGW